MQQETQLSYWPQHLSTSEQLQKLRRSLACSAQYVLSIHQLVWLRLPSPVAVIERFPVWTAAGAVLKSRTWTHAARVIGYIIPVQWFENGDLRSTSPGYHQSSRNPNQPPPSNLGILARPTCIERYMPAITEDRKGATHARGSC